MSDYSSMLEKYRDKKTRELRELRQTLSKRRTSNPPHIHSNAAK